MLASKLNDNLFSCCELVYNLPQSQVAKWKRKGIFNQVIDLSITLIMFKHIVICFSKSDLRNHSQNCQALSCAPFLPQSKLHIHACYLSPSFIMCFTVCNFSKTSPLITHCQKCHLLLNDSCAPNKESVGPTRFWSFHYVYRPQEQLLTNLSVVFVRRSQAVLLLYFLSEKGICILKGWVGKRQHRYNNSST